MLDTSNLMGLTSNSRLEASARLTAAGTVKKMDSAQIDQAAQDFESMFIGQMMEQMFGESLGDELFGDQETNDVYKGLMMEEYGKQITRAGGIGIADYVKRELLKLQEI